MSEQFDTLLKIAETQYKRLNNHVGVPIDGESHEKFNLYCSYPIDRCIKTDGTWDIPQYTNGSTRHSKCVFLLPPTYTGNGSHAYICKNNDTMEERFIDSNYDREKLLIKEYFGGDLIEIVWSYDFGEPDDQGQYYYWVDNWWFSVKINGILTEKEKDIKNLQYN